VDPSLPNPLLGQRFFLDRMEAAYIQWAKWRRAGQASHADTIWKLAREPRFRWFGKFTRPRMQKKIRGYLNRVQCDQPGTVPLMAVMRHQGKGCSGTYRAGGEAEDRSTMRWYDDFVESVGDARVVIAFEPDSLGTIDCHARSRRDDRIQLLRYGVNALSQLPNATIYLEATASDWEPADRVAKLLRAIGIANVRGFMLNATHYDWTSNNVRFGLEVSRRTGGKHFVINTAENGRGPIHYRLSNGRRINVWCNPGLRGLGPRPTTDTSHPMVDAYLWINRPGYAQSCQHRPIAWYPARALNYARYATDWESPPAGTKFGHFKRYSLRALGVRR
jgi:endoglucanase